MIGAVFVTGIFGADTAEAAAAEPSPDAKRVSPDTPAFHTGLFWSGSWNTDNYLINRIDLQQDAGDFFLRAQLVERHSAFPWENDWQGLLTPGFGLYHNPTGSRLLYGALDTRGLPALLSNPWAKSVPFTEKFQIFGADLKTTPSSTAAANASLQLQSPQLGLFRLYAALTADPAALNPQGGGLLYSGGADITWDKQHSLNFQALYYSRILEAQQQASWFSESPSLPNRDFRIFGFSSRLDTPFFGLAAAGAYSQTFAWGSDPYASLALNFGGKAWKFSVAADAAGPRFVDHTGKAVGSGLRIGQKFEWKQKQGSLFRISSSFRSLALMRVFDRGDLGFYYHFPVSSSKKKAREFFQPLTIKAEISRNVQNLQKITDKAKFSVSFRFGIVTSASSGSFSVLSNANNYSASLTPIGNTPLPLPFAGESFSAAGFTLAQNISFNFKPYSLSFKFGCGVDAGKPPVIDFSASASLQNTWGRLSVTISSADFPGKWAVLLSWRLSGGFDWPGSLSDL